MRKCTHVEPIFTLYGLLAFNVQYWNGSSWITIPGGSVTGNNKVWRKFTFSPITTNKIRVTITAVPDSWSRVVEIQAFGTSAGGEKVQWLVSVGETQDWQGLYIDWEGHSARAGTPSNTELGEGAATTADLADAIAGESINIARGGEIVFFGCNTDALASHLSSNLAARGRGDIRVTGAVGNTSEQGRRATTDRGNNFNTYRDARLERSTRTRSYQ